MVGTNAALQEVISTEVRSTTSVSEDKEAECRSSEGVVDMLLMVSSTHSDDDDDERMEDAVESCDW